MTPLLSVVIPSHDDIYLHQTVDSLLQNAARSIEVIVVLDGYEPKTPVVADPRVRVVRLGAQYGMREAINSGVHVARAPWIMRSDEHCMFGRCYDALLLEEIEENWIVTPRRYRLDPVRWELMEGRAVDYEKLIIKESKSPKFSKFSGVEWISRAKERALFPVDETMAMQGSCWIMARTWWDRVIGRLQTEGYGPLYQDSTEMVFKTWRAGGRLMVCKKTWFAHKHRDFQRSHHYPIERAIPEWAYALNLWADDYEKARAVWGL